MLIQNRMDTSIETCISLICCFASEHKLIRLLEKLPNRSLKCMIRKIWHIASIMFMQIGDNLHVELKMAGKEYSGLLCLRFITGNNDCRSKAFQLFSQPARAYLTFRRQVPCISRAIFCYLRQRMFD